MVLSLVEIREKLRPQLKSLWDIDDFKVVRAERKDKFWILIVEYQESERGPAGVVQYFRTRTSGLSVEAETGKIDSLID